MPGVVLAGQRVTASMFSFTIANLATGQINNSTSEAVVGSLAIPGGGASNQGYQFHIEGTNDNQASASTVTFRLRLGTTGTTSDLLLMTYAAVATQGTAKTGLQWDLNGWFRIETSGSSGSVYLNSSLTSIIASTTTAAQPGLSGTNPSPVNWTVGTFLTVTAQWGAANASNVTRTLSGSLAALN